MIQYLLVCCAFGTLVVPYWPSNAFWPFLFASSSDYQPCVAESIYFPDPSEIFILGCYKDSLIGSDKFKLIPQKSKLPMNFFKLFLNVLYEALFRKNQN